MNTRPTLCVPATPVASPYARWLRACTGAGAAVLLAGPTVIAFFSGGYFDADRLLATLIAWLLVGIAMLIVARPLPVERGGVLAVVGLVALACWTAASFAWAPVAGTAQADLERILLYTGVLIAAAALLRDSGLARWIEPALAAGALIVIVYGLGERLLPGLLHYARSSTAGGRLEQPLRYWNAEGALAAIGLVLCARLAGDRQRPLAMRRLGAAGAAPLGAGYLSFSRGAIVAVVAGLVVLVCAAPSVAQLRAALLAALTAVLAAAAVGPFPGVASLHGGLAARERDGAIALGLLLVIAVSAALVTPRVASSDRRLGDGAPEAQIRVRARARAVAIGTIVAALIGLIIGALGDHRDPRSFGAQASRLTSIGSYRADYWKEAVRSFIDHPLNGLGSGSFRVAWLRQRTIPVAALDAHSLELQTAAELGVPGLLALLLVLGGVAGAVGRAHRRDPELVAGWLAVLGVWLLHSAIDWDWQMPAVTLLAAVLAGAAIAHAHPGHREGANS